MSCTVKYRLHFCFPVYLFVIQRPSQNDTTAIFKKFRICIARNASIGLPMHEVYPKCFRTRIYKKGLPAGIRHLYFLYKNCYQPSPNQVTYSPRVLKVFKNDDNLFSQMDYLFIKLASIFDSKKVFVAVRKRNGHVCVDLT